MAFEAWSRWVRADARAAAGSLLTGLASLALAGAPARGQAPFPELSRRLIDAARPVDVLLVIDRSASMAASWPAVVRAVEQYAPTMAGAHLAIVGFDSSAYDLITSGAATQAAEFTGQLRRAGPPTGRHTNIHAGVAAACDWLGNRSAGRAQVIVLVSDGRHEPARGTPDSSTQIAQRCSGIARVRDVSFLAVGVPPSIDFGEYRKLLPPPIRLDEVRVGVGDLATLLQRMRLLTLARREMGVASGDSGWVRVDSVGPRADDDGLRAVLRGVESARVFASLRAPTPRLRACFRGLEAGATGPSAVEARTSETGASCVEPGERLAVTFDVARRPPSSTWARILEAMRPSTARDELVRLQVRATLAPEPGAELVALGDSALRAVPIAAAVALPVAMMGGTSPLVHALVLVALVLLVLLRWPAPRLYGRVSPAATTGRGSGAMAGIDGIDLGTVGASRYLYHLPDGSQLRFVARKHNPVGLRGSRSRIGLDVSDGTETQVTDPDGELRWPSRDSVVWLQSGDRITIQRAGNAGPIHLEWN